MSWVVLGVSPDGARERYASSMDHEGLVYATDKLDGATVFEDPGDAKQYHTSLARMRDFRGYNFFLLDLEYGTRLPMEPPPPGRMSKGFNRFYPNDDA